MPSSIAEPLFDRLLRAFPADRAYTRDDWSDDPMPEPIRYFLAQLLRHQGRFEAERLRRARSEWVDYDHPDMERALRTFFAAVEDHVRIPRSEWSDTLHQATHHVTSYLIQPTHVLGEFVFDDRTDPLPLDQVMWRMKFFGPYAYLRDAVRAYIKQRDDDRLTRSVFETFLRRIDHRVTAEYDADRWIRLLGPLFRLVRTATGQMAAPVEPLALFFEEKGAGDIAERLRTRTSSSARLDPDELRGHLQQALPEDPTGAPGDRSSPLPDSVSSPLEASSPLASPSPDSSPDSVPDSARAPSAPSSNAPPNTRAPEAPSEDNSAAKPAAEESAKSSNVKSYSMEDISRGSRTGPSSGASDPSADSSSADADDNASPSSDSSSDPDDEIWGVEGSARAMQSADDGEAPPSGDAGGGANDSSVPLWKQFQSGRSRSSRAAREEQENGSDTPLWARFRSSGDAPSGGRGRPDNSASESRDAASDAETSDASPSSASTSSPASSTDAAPGGSASSRSSGELAILEQSVLGERNPPQRDMYVRQLFAGSEAAYERVLRRLDGIDSWSQASQVIAQDVFRKHKVNIYSDAAVRFTNAVESRFRA